MQNFLNDHGVISDQGSVFEMTVGPVGVATGLWPVSLKLAQPAGEIPAATHAHRIEDFSEQLVAIRG